jgi:hypothetical protein
MQSNPSLATRKATKQRSKIFNKAKRKYSITHKKFMESILLYSEEVIYWHSVFQQRIVELLLSSWSNPESRPSSYDYKAIKFFEAKSEYAKKLLNMVKLPKKGIERLEVQTSQAVQKSHEAYARWRSIGRHTSPETADHDLQSLSSNSESFENKPTSRDFLRRYYLYRRYKAYQLGRDLEEAKRVIGLVQQINRAQETLRRI